MNIILASRCSLCRTFYKHGTRICRAWSAMAFDQDVLAEVSPVRHCLTSSNFGSVDAFSAFLFVLGIKCSVRFFVADQCHSVPPSILAPQFGQKLHCGYAIPVLKFVAVGTTSSISHSEHVHIGLPCHTPAFNHSPFFRSYIFFASAYPL